jgi:membrane protein
MRIRAVSCNVKQCIEPRMSSATESDSAPPPMPGSTRVWQRWRALRDWVDPAHLRPRLHRAREIVQFAARRARDVRLGQVAGSLTFTTVLSIVPLLAVALAIFASFPMFSDFRVALEKNLIRELLPEGMAGALMRNLNTFAAKATQLTAAGLLFLAVTAMLMIATVDRVLNELWVVHQQRPLMQRIALYWALITVGPVLIGGSLAATSYLWSISAGMARDLPGGLRAVIDYAPVAAWGLAYAALYVLVPNRKVAWHDALIGGFAAALVGEVIKTAFTAYIKTGTIATVYGAFAAVPLFLLWVYLSWFVVLFGAAIASTIPMLRATRFADEQRAGNAFVTALALLRVLQQAAAADGEKAAADLAIATRTRAEEVDRLLQVMEKLGYVRELGGERTGLWRFVADPARATLRPLWERLALDPALSLWARDRLAVSQWLTPLQDNAALDRPLGQP